jgi:DICT domain-containing protein
MSLASVIDDVEAREKTLTVFNPSPDREVVSRLSSYFETQNVRVVRERTSSGRPSGFAILSDENDLLASTSEETLEELLEGGALETDALGVDDTEYRDFLQYLKETTFTSYSKQQMIEASREIEDRAWRVGTGELHAGFQFVSTIESQLGTYRELARSKLSIHIYAAPDGSSIDIDGATVHVEDDEELASLWFVVFDGGQDEHAKSALVAEERSPGSYYGFWTYDPQLVDRILSLLDASYGYLTQ